MLGRIWVRKTVISRIMELSLTWELVGSGIHQVLHDNLVVQKLCSRWTTINLPMLKKCSWSLVQENARKIHLWCVQTLFWNFHRWRFFNMGLWTGSKAAMNGLALPRWFFRQISKAEIALSCIIKLADGWYTMYSEGNGCFIVPGTRLNFIRISNSICHSELVVAYAETPISCHESLILTVSVCVCVCVGACICGWVSAPFDTNGHVKQWWKSDLIGVLVAK